MAPDDRQDGAAALSCEGVSLAYGASKIIDTLDVAIGKGRITGLIGSNGSGKSTLLRGLGRLMKPVRGQVLLDGKAIHTMNTRDVARRLGILPQSPTAPELVTVAELVMQGRAPHRGLLRQWSVEDQGAAARALELTNMADLAERPLDTLSGGQRQRAWIAMTLAQETDILLLDEPTTFLDLAHQVEVLELLCQLRDGHGATIVVVLHDLNQAARYCDRLVVMKDGRLVAEGAPAEVVTADIVQHAFGLACRIIADPETGTPLCIPVRRPR